MGYAGMSLVSNGIVSGYSKENRHPFYGNLDCAKQVAMFNGVVDVRTVELSAGQSLSDLGEASVDVVMSATSWGYHYPIDNGYLSEVRRILKHDGIILVTLRQGTDGKQRLAESGFECVNLPQQVDRPYDLVQCSRG